MEDEQFEYVCYSLQCYRCLMAPLVQYDQRIAYWYQIVTLQKGSTPLIWLVQIVKNYVRCCVNISLGKNERVWRWCGFAVLMLVAELNSPKPRSNQYYWLKAAENSHIILLSLYIYSVNFTQQTPNHRHDPTKPEMTKPEMSKLEMSPTCVFLHLFNFSGLIVQTTSLYLVISTAIVCLLLFCDLFDTCPVFVLYYLFALDGSRWKTKKLSRLKIDTTWLIERFTSF